MSSNHTLYTPAWCPILAGTISIPIVLPTIAFLITFLLVYAPKVLPCACPAIRRLSEGNEGIAQLVQRIFTVYRKLVGLDTNLVESDEQKAAYMGMIEEEKAHREQSEGEARIVTDVEEPEEPLPAISSSSRVGILALAAVVCVGGAIVNFFYLLFDVALIYFSLRLVNSPLVPANIDVMRAHIPPMGMFLDLLGGIEFDNGTAQIIDEYHCYSLKLSLALWVLVALLLLLGAAWTSDLPFRWLGFVLRVSRIRKDAPGRLWKLQLAQPGLALAVAAMFALSQILWSMLPSTMSLVMSCPDQQRDEAGNCISGSQMDQVMFAVLVPVFFALVFGGLVPLMWRNFVGSGFALPAPERVKCFPGSHNLADNLARWGCFGVLIANSVIFSFAMIHAFVNHLNAAVGVWNAEQINAQELDAKTSKVLQYARPLHSAGHEDLYSRQAESRKARRLTLRVLANSLGLFWAVVPGAMVAAKLIERLNHTLIFFSGDGSDVGVEDENVYAQPIRWVTWLLNVLWLSLVVGVVLSPAHYLIVLLYVLPQFLWELLLAFRQVPRASAVTPVSLSNSEVDI